MRRVETLLRTQHSKDQRHEMNRHLLLGGKARTNLDLVLKRRDMSLLTKVSAVTKP